MQKIQPSILIAIGHRAQRTLQDYVRRLPSRIPSILPVVVTLASQESVLEDTGAIHRIILAAPEFEEDEWPAWLPTELYDMPASQRVHTRAWMRAALLQQADDVQEFFVSRIPRLSSLDTIEQMSASGISLAGDSVFDIYVIADLNEHLASSVFLDIADLVNHVCQQLGLTARTTGLFYLPDATSPAPAEEAVTYAALKELEHHINNHKYDATSISALMPPYPFRAFDAGCYLLDTVNELGYVLQDESWQIQAASQWLYAMTFSSMASSLYKKQNQRYGSAKLQGKSRIYSSFGIAVRYIPKKALEDWLVTKLSHSIVTYLVDTQSSADVQKRVNAFVESLGLTADTLKERLRHQSSPDIGETLNPLRRTGLGQIELRTREVLQILRERHLPTLQYNLEKNLEQIRDETREALDATVQATLQDVPFGGISTVCEFLKAMADTISDQQQEVQAQRKQQKVDLKRSLITVSNAHYALRSVLLSIPPWPIVLLSIVATMILPLIYGFQLAKIVRPLSEIGANLALGVLATGMLATMTLVGLRLFRQKKVICTQHVEMIYERFGIESASPVSRTINSIYEAIQKDIEDTLAEIVTLTTDMQLVSSYLEAKQVEYAETLKRESSPGPTRSVVSLDRAESFYQQIVSEQVVSKRQRLVPVVDQLASDFVTTLGPITAWLRVCTQSGQPLEVWFRENLNAFGRDYILQQIPTMTAADFLSEGTESDKALEQILRSAQPLWNYDPRALRQAKTQRLSLVGGSLNETHYANLKQLLPQTAFVDTGDPNDLVILNVHRGMPLFALRRLGEYRTHYAAMLQHGKLPIHITHEMALSDDLLTTQPKQQLAPATLFAVGLAFNLLRRDPDGRYVAPRSKDISVRLSSNKTRAAALLGMDRMVCKELQRRLDDLTSSKDPGAIHSVLDEYMAVVPDLEDWEVKGILSFYRAYGVEVGNGPVVIA
ncbi:MAG: hypothetical protein JXA89_07020 [Anaerolineae bacterium]|nr:hypothetical protein [Anaerolineae bacterium]